MKEEVNVAMVVVPQGEYAPFAKQLINNIYPGFKSEIEQHHQITLDDENNNVRLKLEIFNHKINNAARYYKDKQFFIVVTDAANDQEAPSIEGVLNAINNQAPRAAAFAIFGTKNKEKKNIYSKFEVEVSSIINLVANHNQSAFTADDCYAAPLNKRHSIYSALLKVIWREEQLQHASREKQRYQKFDRPNDYLFFGIATLGVGASAFQIVANCGIISAVKLAPFCISVYGAMIPHAMLAAFALLLVFMLWVGGRYAYDYYDRHNHTLFKNKEVKFKASSSIVSVSSKT